MGVRHPHAEPRNTTLLYEGFEGKLRGIRRKSPPEGAPRAKRGDCRELLHTIRFRKCNA